MKLKILSHFFSTFIIFILISSCSVQILAPEKIYTENFLKMYDGIFKIYRDGDNLTAEKKLNQFNDEELNSDEKAKKYNLLGIIAFHQGYFKVALDQFRVAQKNVKLDISLKQQILLNIASNYFKMEKIDLSKKELDQIKEDLLSHSDRQKYFKMKLAINISNDNYREIVISLINLLDSAESVNEIESKSTYVKLLTSSYFKLSDTERVYLLEKYVSTSPEQIKTLAYLEVDRRYYLGDKITARDILNWMKKSFKDDKKLQLYIERFFAQMDSVSKLEQGKIGVVLPFNSQYVKYSNQVIEGLDIALMSILNNEKGDLKNKKNFQLIIRDNDNNVNHSREMIKQLISDENVSVIIGGLLPNLAVEEYFEASRNGTLFISLSPLDIPIVKKNHLLIELPGSFQSQLEILKDESLVKILGEKHSLFVPSTWQDGSFLEEAIRYKDLNSNKVKIVGSYETDKKNFKHDVQNFLGLAFPNERQEELYLINEVNKSKGQSSIRRVQNLKPILDVDFIYMPAIPPDAIELISYFSYFDANKVTFVGPSSWGNSRDLLNEQKKNFSRKLYFLSSPLIDQSDYLNFYKNKSNNNPSFLSLMAREAIHIISDLNNNFTKVSELSREEYSGNLFKLNKISSSLVDFEKINNLWIKKLALWQISRGQISQVKTN